jgi:hypothetical protein
MARVIDLINRPNGELTRALERILNARGRSYYLKTIGKINQIREYHTISSELAKKGVNSCKVK